jgi:hypothetical protein
MEQLSGAAQQECLNSPTNTADGWCYVDPTLGVGNPALVAQCPPSGRRKLRFRDDAPPPPGRITFIMCTDHSPYPSLGPARNGAIGDACTPSLEAEPTFSGLANTEVSVELGSRQCSTGLCLMNHFRGRVTCPYGQSERGVAASSPGCTVPTGSGPVTIEVEPQDSMRRSDDAVYCSCRCGGPGPGPFCACPQGYACTPLVDDVGLASSGAIAGSYCIKQGTEFRGFEGVLCDYDVRNCE